MWSLSTWFPIAALILLLVQLIAPVVAYLVTGWMRRKNSIMEAFDDDSAKDYFDTFHAQAREELRKAKDIEKRKALKEKIEKAMLSKYYDLRFSRWKFFVPSAIGFAVAILFLGFCAIALHTWLSGQRFTIPGDESIRTGVVFAIIGGYTWVMYDIILKSCNERLNPRDLYWASFRLIISAPAGYAMGLLAAPGIRETIAFCLGAFPAWTLRSLARRIVAASLPTDSASGESGTELVALPSIDVNGAQSLFDEGITTIHELANWDPVELTMRLGQPFSYIVGIISDALLWQYLGTKDNFDKFRIRGVNGAYDCCLLNYDLHETDDEDDQKKARAVLKDLAAALSIDVASAENLVWNVAMDPNALFIFAVWGDIRDYE